MPTTYTPILQLALPATGELNGTWGTTVNDNITSMVEQAIAGLATISTWTTASHTLTTANGTTSEARCAILECSGAPGAAATVICPTASKVYIIKNSVTGGYAVTLKTSAGTGVSVANGGTALLYCDGTNVVSGGGLNGDVVGPASATDTAIATFDGVTGKLIKNNASTTIASNVITALGFTGPHNGTVGATTPTTGVFTTVQSTITTGTAPLTVASTTNVANLNASSLSGATFAAPGAIGSTTAGSGAFTTLSASSTVSGTGFTNYLASPPAIGGTAAAAGSFTTLTSSTSFVPTAYTETIVASGTVGATATLAITAGTVLTATLTSATACTFTMPAATAGKSFTLLLKQPASGTATTATFTGVKWNSSGAPTITATVGKLDIIAFVADGTNWYGTASQGYTY